MQEDRDLDALKNGLAEIYGVDLAELDAHRHRRAEQRGRSATRCGRAILQKYETKEALIPTEILRRVERDIMLQIVDSQWKDHLYSLDHLKEGIGLRGYGQKDPLVEYKKESFALFSAMKDRIEEEIVRYLWRLTPMVGSRRPRCRLAGVRQPRAATTTADDDERARTGAVAVRRDRRRQRERRGRTAASGADRRRRRGQAGPARRAEDRTQRPLSLRIGKKYKKCHGA